MIHKIIHGRGFAGCLRYIMNSNKGQLIGGTYGIDESVKAIASDFGRIGHSRGDIERPVFHAVLSLRPGEVLTDSQWNQAARRYLEDLGYDDCPYVVVRHVDPPHDHVHIVATRVRYDGTVVSTSHDFSRGLASVRDVSRELGLVVVRSASDERALTLSEIHASYRASLPNLRLELQQLLRNAASGSPTISDFITRLDQAGVRVIPNITSAGSIRGLSFSYEGHTPPGARACWASGSRS